MAYPHSRPLASATALALLFAASSHSYAQDDQEPGTTVIDEIVVSPNRTPTERSKVGSKVERIDRKQIERQALPQVTDYLAILPGVAISAPGGIGAEGSLAIRGAPRRYVKTLYNGIDISDPTSTQVQTSYQYLLADGIDSIEVLKGSQSTLYGSDAIAGVISLSSLGGVDLGVRHLVRMEGGSHGTVRGHYGLRAADQNGRFAFNALGLTTDGISAAAGGRERDGYDNVTFDAAGEYRLSENVSVFGSALYIDAKAEYDNDGAVPTDNPFNHNLSDQIAGRMGVNVDFMDGRLKNTVSVQGFQLDRAIRSVSQFGPFDADYAGTRAKIDYQGSFEATDWLLFQYGADHEKQRAEVTDNYGTDTDEDFSLTGVWGQAVVEPIENLTLTAGLRHDSHSQFGDYTTYRGTGSYLLPDFGTRFHSSVGTGFRAPSLYELYGPFVGNTTLQPETSFSFDVGVEQTLLDGLLVADVTFFLLDIDDLIQYVNFAYNQVPGTTRQRGVETSLAWSATPWLDLGAAYTYTQSETETGARNIRIPRHAVSLAATARPWEQWEFSAITRIAADTVDSGNFELDDYVLVNAKAAYKPTEDTELYVRVENLFDVDYQTVRGYGSPGISVFGGFKAEF